jgi:hypothetical protein
MTDLTDEDKKILEEMEREALKPRKPYVGPHPDKFTEPVLVPAEKYRDWHDVIQKKERRPPKAQRRKQPPKK